MIVVVVSQFADSAILFCIWILVMANQYWQLGMGSMAQEEEQSSSNWKVLGLITGSSRECQSVLEQDIEDEPCPFWTLFSNDNLCSQVCHLCTQDISQSKAGFTTVPKELKAQICT